MNQVKITFYIAINAIFHAIFIDAYIEEEGRVIEYDSFDEYKSLLKRRYFYPFEEVRSRRAFEENSKKIREHNTKFQDGKTSFKLRANCLADLNNRAYLKKYVRLVKSPLSTLINRTADVVGGVHLSDELPEELDWREKGFVTNSDNQGSCGACYAFSISQSIQGQVFKRTGKLIPLSEQQIVDCSVMSGNHGCSGGSLRNTLRYLETYGGLMRRKDYKYRSKQGICQFVRDLSIVNVTSWAILPQRDENAIMMSLAKIGPIAVSINASPQTFQLYSHGIYDDNACSSDQVNHAMLAVGYTKDYWILKNWWSSDWGENGYMRIKRGKNLCGVANYAAYAIV